MMISVDARQNIAMHLPNGILRRLHVAFVVALVLMLSGISTTRAQRNNKPNPVRKEFRKFCGRDVPELHTYRQATLVNWLIEATGEKSLLVSTSTQHDAACWMLYQDPLRKTVHKRKRALFLQRYALATFFFATKGPTTWESSDGRLGATTMTHNQQKLTSMPTKTKKSGGGSSFNTTSVSSLAYKEPWLSKAHECSWHDVTCNMQRKVISLEISFHKLGGLLPRELFLLSSLKELDLHGNDLQGIIPHKAVSHWKNMKTLRLHMNSLFGSLHEEMRHMKSLQELHIYGNYMAGTLPKQLAELTKLSKIDLYANSFQGTIPYEYGTKLSNLRELDLHDNDFIGTMPKSICDRKLKVLVADCLGPNPEIKCDCCTICCRGLPEMKCVQMSTGEIVIP